MAVYLLGFALCLLSCAFHKRGMFECNESPAVDKIKAVTYLVHVLVCLGCWFMFTKPLR